MADKDQDLPGYTRHKSVHEMTPEERTESMREWAEEQKFIQPGTGELLGPQSGVNNGNYNTVAFGNEWQGGGMSFKMARSGYEDRHLASPSYKAPADGQSSDAPAAERKPSIFKRVFKREGKEPYETHEPKEQQGTSTPARS